MGHRKTGRNTFGDLVEFKVGHVLKLSEALSAVLYMIEYFEGMEPYGKTSKLDSFSPRGESYVLQIVCVLLDC